MEIQETEAAGCLVSLLTALETSLPPPRARAMGLAFANAVHGTFRDFQATLADLLFVLLDATGSRTMRRVTAPIHPKYGSKTCTN